MINMFFISSIPGICDVFSLTSRPAPRMNRPNYALLTFLPGVPANWSKVQLVTIHFRAPSWRQLQTSSAFDAYSDPTNSSLSHPSSRSPTRLAICSHA